MTPEQAFKIGFLFRCAEQGLSQQETGALVKQAIATFRTKQASIEKQAILPAAILSALGGLGSGMMGLGGKVVGALPGLASTGGALAIGAPVLAGAGTGYLAAKMTQSDNRDALAEAKQEEVVGEYERLTDEAKRRVLLKRIQQQTGKRIVPMSPSLG
jgi:hypothetical protein